tara:strand:+ start:533 stop:1690 length:1158 start_codon:yes stop_codon:yes gene_type:complete
MKKFSSFLNEAQRSFAAKEAEKLNLTHVGYGKYADVRGNVTHMSQQGKLVKLTADQQQGDQVNGGEETEGGDGKVDQGSISITFGRFNPPTTGHETLIKKVANSAKNGEYRIYPSRTQDPKKNPLDPSTKVKFMHKAYPDHTNNIVANDDMRTIFDVLTALDDEGYSSVNIVVGGDRVSEFNSLATKYNGKAYNFDDIKVTSAGDRDPDGEGVEGMSASKLRKAAAEDDYDTFVAGMPKGLSRKDRQELYNTLRQSMQVEECIEDFGEVSYQLYEIAPKLDPKGLREAYFEQGLFSVGCFVENVNTGIIGKVVSRGSNYVITIDEHDNVYRSWLKDLVEHNDIKGFNFTPAGEIGTDELANVLRQMTPGEFIKKINKKGRIKTAR